jgi:hypothetical protein
MAPVTTVRSDDEHQWKKKKHGLSLTFCFQGRHGAIVFGRIRSFGMRQYFIRCLRVWSERIDQDALIGNGRCTSFQLGQMAVRLRDRSQDRGLSSAPGEGSVGIM